MIFFVNAHDINEVLLHNCRCFKVSKKGRAYENLFDFQGILKRIINHFHPHHVRFHHHIH